jgi:hypothetical protein
MESGGRSVTVAYGGAGLAPRWRLRDYAPLPLVAVAALLVVLILFIPVLISTGQPAPGILTQAELIVDRIPGNATTHLYVHALGTTARYSEIWLGLAGGFDWSGAGTPIWSSLNWTTWWNESDVLSVSVAAAENPVGVNVTAQYVSPGGCARYVGVMAFFVGPAAGGGDALYSASPSGLGLPSAPVPVDNSSLPLTILLPLTASGCPP